MKDHDGNVIAFNTWFEDTAAAIVREEGNSYNEYVRQLFRAYLEWDNSDFTDAIKEEHRAWVQGKKDEEYSHTDLLELGSVTYNNIIDEAESVGKKVGERRRRMRSNISSH